MINNSHYAEMAVPKRIVKRVNQLGRESGQFLEVLDYFCSLEHRSN